MSAIQKLSLTHKGCVAEANPTSYLNYTYREYEERGYVGIAQDGNGKYNRLTGDHQDPEALAEWIDSVRRRANKSRPNERSDTHYCNKPKQYTVYNASHNYTWKRAIPGVIAILAIAIFVTMPNGKPLDWFFSNNFPENCSSDYAVSFLKDTIASSPSSSEDVRLLYVSDAKKIDVEPKYEHQLDCKGTLHFNTGRSLENKYRFFVRDDQLYVRIR